MANVYDAARGKKVLIPEGYCKQCLPFIRGFKDLGCEVTILCSSKLDCGYASRLPDHKILGVCDLKKPAESERYIVDLVKTGDYDIVVPIFDFAARILAHHKKELSEYATIYVNDKEVFDRASDKNEVMRVCEENGIPCPRTLYSVGSVEDVEAGGVPFPLIIKPKSMYGARGFHRFEDLASLRQFVTSEGIDLSEYVVQEAIPEGSLLIGANVFVDRNGEIKSSYLFASEHIYPEDGGTSTLNGFLVRDDIREYCEKLVLLMDLRGQVGVDLMIDTRDGVAKVIEINPRPVHAITMGFFFGVDHARQMLEDALGLPVTAMKINRTDTAVRITQTDMLWFLKSPNRIKRSPRRLGYKRVKDQMMFLDDPLPWFAFLLDGVKNYRQKMKEKAH